MKDERTFQLPALLERYSEASVFSRDPEEAFKPGEVLGPVVVGKNPTILTVDEVALLEEECWIRKDSSRKQRRHM